MSLEEKTIEANTVDQSSQYQNVVVLDVKMKFISMVIFMIKWSIAAIPAFIILVAVMMIIVGFFFGTVKK